MVFLEEIWSRNLYNLMVAPVTPYHIIFGAMVTGLLKITLSSGMAIFLAYILFSYSLFHLGIALAKI
ncbi:MAG: ABC transporter permease, partial [Nitrospirae bacterium]|nr:ABC transporter permease [Nitrospirota bacterium]